MSELLPDVPAAVVVVHLLALTTLLGHTAVISLRRLVRIRQSRQNTPNALWFRLLQISLGLTK